MKHKSTIRKNRNVRAGKRKPGSLHRMVRRLDVKTDREYMLYLTRCYWI